MGSRPSRRIVTAAITVAAAALLAACGSATQHAGQRIAGYLRSVNAVERQLAKPLATVSRASAQIGTATGSAAKVKGVGGETRALNSAHSAIIALRARLAALPAPSQAATLRTLLLSLADGQARLTAQTTRLVAYLPAFSADMHPLSAELLRMERALAVNQASGSQAVQAVYAGKAAALRAFAASATRIDARLGRLEPPPVARPEFTAERRSLSGMAAAARRLAAALAVQQTTGLSGLLSAFDKAASSASTAAVTRAQAAAVRRYDRQVQALTTLENKADTERARLATQY